ncbi:RcnB family protein [Hydrogenophaga sp. T2]|uniref:RcnB family protein n=1 Tax=Hydrogenophaga sp. T2 TaxID=3132823 RepID=UPI003CE6B5C9
MQARDLLSIAVATATFAMGTTAFADDDRRGGRRHHDGPRIEHRHVERHVDRRVIHHGPPRHVERHIHHHGPRVVHRDVRIVHPGPRWARGHYVPPEYRHGRYVVRHHHPRLYTPPRGHHWIQVNGDFLLVAAATGLIAHVLLNQ